MMKKPVVATTVGGLPEMIDHRSTGILCPPRDSLALADAVTELLENESLRESICERAFSHAQENMTFSHMMVAMCAFYSEVLAK
jgi:glycosyltransferase involved in cell wall biosynthesis